MPNADAYVVLAGFASQHSRVTLSGHDDSALLVRDTTRMLKVKLQMLRRTDSGSRDQGSQRATPVPFKRANEACQDDMMSGSVSSNARADKSETILLAQPWNSSRFALRVNDVVYSKGESPVVLSAGDAIQLCEPGSFTDSLTFFVAPADAVGAVTHGADDDAKDKRHCAGGKSGGGSHDGAQRGAEPVAGSPNSVAVTNDARPSCPLLNGVSDAEQCRTCATQTEWSRVAQEGCAGPSASHLAQALEEWTSYYGYYYGGPRSLPSSSDYVGLVMHNDDRELRTTVDDILLLNRRRNDGDAVRTSVNRASSICGAGIDGNSSSKETVAGSTAWLQLIDSMKQPLPTA